MTFPALPFSKVHPPWDGKSVSSPALIQSVYQSGFQSAAHPPSVWKQTGAVLGHPVPLLVWDFLDAFPNAKVILTVRQADELWESLRELSPEVASAQTSPGVRGQQKMWLWGLPQDSAVKLDKRQFLRRYWQHNAKVIHGVPKSQLLVWDVHAQPKWEPLCSFLGKKVPNIPFVKPGVGEF